jgi:hypothetical protein
MNLQLQMNQACFRFYEELNDFLPPEQRKVPFSWSFHGNPSVKFAIEAMGVPHYQDFWKCSACGRIYWKGSHYNRMSEFVEGINEK